MLPVLQIGPLALQFPGLLIILGIWLGLTLAERNAQKFNITDSHIYNLVFLNLLTGVIGARLTFIVSHLDAFQGNLLNIFSLNAGLLDIWGGIGFAIIASLIYIQRNHLQVWSLLDSLVPFFSAFQVSLSLSFLASGKFFGTPTTLPWGIDLWNQIRHPNQLYYALAGIAILIILLRFIIPRYHNHPRLTFLLFTTMLSFVYSTLNVFDATGTILLNQFRLEPIIFWIILAIGVYSIHFFIQKENADSNPI